MNQFKKYYGAYGIIALLLAIGVVPGSIPVNADEPTTGVGSVALFSVTPENFISFVRTPPTIDTLIYERIIFNKPRRFKTQEEADRFVKDYQAGKFPKENRSEELFALRYLSPREFVFQQLDDVTNLWSKTTRLMTFCGRSDGTSWTLGPNGAISTDSTNGIYKTRGEDNLVFIIQYQFATELLRLGMLDIDPATIQRVDPQPIGSKDVSFIARSTDGQSIIGFAKIVDGLISTISYTIQGGSGRVQGRVIDLTHDHGILHSLRISNRVRGQPDPVPVSVYEIMAPPVMASAASNISCGVKQFLTESDGNVLIKENGELYTVRQDTQVLAKAHPVPGGAIISVSNGGKKIILVLIFCLTLIMPLMMLRRCNKVPPTS